MSRERLEPAALQRKARMSCSWRTASENDPIAMLYSERSPQFQELDRKLQLTDQALRMLCALNDFDRKKVAEELLDICRYPNSPEADTGRKNWFSRLFRSRYPFKGYHYKIRYTVEPNGHVKVDDIYFDQLLLGPKVTPGLERNALYKVKRQGDARFDAGFTDLGDNRDKVVDQLTDAWGKDPEPAYRVDTRYAAVNGMLNPLQKASWLMGAHLDAAYSKEKFSEYTLFHNPSDGGVEDGFECVFDKRMMPSHSHNVQHFAAVMYEAQTRGNKTHWVAHSQGAIIFSRAVSLAMQKYGTSLSCHSVSLHGVGCNLGNVRMACIRAGIKIDSVRNNPYDLVPNIGGMNDMGGSGLVRSFVFMGLVGGKNSHPLASPHTLPYLGLETYIHQLEFCGNHKRAAFAKRYRPS